MAMYRLPNGRQVLLVYWYMKGTYSGHLEGSLESISKYERRHLPKRVAAMLTPGCPLTIVEPPEGILPDWMCLAHLDSYPGVHNTDPDFASELYVCWFVADTSKSLDAMIEDILPDIDWENIAKDYNTIP